MVQWELLLLLLPLQIFLHTKQYMGPNGKLTHTRWIFFAVEIREHRSQTVIQHRTSICKIQKELIILIYERCNLFNSETKGRCHGSFISDTHPPWLEIEIIVINVVFLSAFNLYLWILRCIKYNAFFTGRFFIHKMSKVVQEYNVSNILRNYRKIHQSKGLAVVETG